jgi:hypothetical protein
VGAVLDGRQTCSARPRPVSGSGAAAGARGGPALGAGVRDDPRGDPATDSSPGFRRSSRDHRIGARARLDPAAGPLSPDQPAARQPGPSQAALVQPQGAGSDLSADATSLGTARRTGAARSAQAVRTPRAPTARRPPVRMAAREFLRRCEHFRAYRRYPELDLPTTTGAVEAMGHIVRELMHRLRNVRTPQALRLWTTALIRLRPEVRCNSKSFQPNKSV